MPLITTELPNLPEGFSYTGEYRSVRTGELGLGIRDGEWSIMRSEQDADLPLFIIRERPTPCKLTVITTPDPKES